MGAPIIFSGSNAKLLKPNLDFFGNSKIFTGTVVPTITATAGNPGDMYLNSTVPGWFIKNDAGTTTNWKLVTPSVGGTVTIQSFTSGSATYTTPAGVSYLRVKLVGGGGGGGGSGAGAGNGGTGGTSSFGTSLLSGTGGTGGAVSTGAGGTGGTASIGTAIGFSATGGSGTASPTVTGNANAGGDGASSPFGGAGGGGYVATAGSSAVANTGSGGGGAGGVAASSNPGPGGGAGGYVDAYIVSPSATYSYSIGAAGAAGAGANVGGTGGSGYIIVEEYYPPTVTVSISTSFRTVTTSQTLLSTDNNSVILVNKSAAITLTMPAHQSGFSVTFKDISGNASTNNITIARSGGTGNFEGVAADKVFQSNYGSWTIMDDGTNYWIQG